MPGNTDVVATSFGIVPYHSVPSTVQYGSVPCTVRNGTVPCNTSPYHLAQRTVQYDTVPKLPISISDYPFLVRYGRDFPEPSTVPLTFVQGLKPYNRKSTHSRNKFTKKKISRTSLIVPRIIEHSKDVDPHLD